MSAVSLTIFGTPKGTDAIVFPPVDLPASLNHVIDAAFLYYAGVEVFRIRRLRVGDKTTLLFTLQTRCHDMRGPRSGAFIGVGIFAQNVSIDPVLLLHGLREMLASALRTVTADGKFSRTITEARNEFAIPDSVVKILKSNVPASWPVSPLPASGSCTRAFWPLSERDGTTPKVLFSMVQAAPDSFPDDLYASTDETTQSDCRLDASFELWGGIGQVLPRRETLWEAQFTRLESEAALLRKDVAKEREALTQANASRQTDIEKATKKSTDDARRLSGDATRLRDENKYLQRQLTNVPAFASLGSPTYGSNGLRGPRKDVRLQKKRFGWLLWTIVVALILAVLLAIFLGGYRVGKGEWPWTSSRGTKQTGAHVLGATPQTSLVVPPAAVLLPPSPAPAAAAAAAAVETSLPLDSAYSYKLRSSEFESARKLANTVVDRYCTNLKSRVEEVANAIEVANAKDVNPSDGRLMGEASKKEQVTIVFKVTSECQIPEGGGISKRPNPTKIATVR